MNICKFVDRGDASHQIKQGCCRMISAVAVMYMLGCAGGPVSYDRHNLSRLWVPEKQDLLYFDATLSPSYPRDSAAAETSRLSWIDEWLKIRKLCTQGYDVIEQRDIRRDEDNPYLHDLRYVLRCR